VLGQPICLEDSALEHWYRLGKLRNDFGRDFATTTVTNSTRVDIAVNAENITAANNIVRNPR